MEEIKRLSEAELESVRALYRQAFPEDLSGFLDYYFGHHITVENVVGLMEGDKVVSMVHLNPYQVMWEDHLYDLSYFVAVATDEAHRRKNYMRKTIQWSLEERFTRGEVFSLLMPIDSRYYDQFGFGFIQDVEVYEFKYTQNNTDRSYVPHSIIGVEDAIALMPIYNGYKVAFNLSHNRGMKAFERLVMEVLSTNGSVVTVPDGYVVYYMLEDRVMVRECAYVSKEGFKNIYHYIGMIAQDMLVEWQMPSENPLKYVVPHAKENRVIRKPFMMARIINVEQLLSDMAHRLSPCIIKVTDDQIYENNGVFVIENMSVKKEETGTSLEPNVTIDVMSLAQWLFGYASLESLDYIRDSVQLVNHDRIFYPDVPITNYFNEFV